MAYVDLSTIHDPQPDESPPAEWGDQIRDNFEALVEAIDALPRGFVGGADLTGSAGGAETALTGSVTHTAEAGRRYKVTAQYGVFTSTDQGNIVFRLKRDGSTVGTHSGAVGGSSFPDRAAGAVIVTTSGISGTTTWSATLQCVSASRSLNTAIGPCSILVEDIGPA